MASPIPQSNTTTDIVDVAQLENVPEPTLPPEQPPAETPQDVVNAAAAATTESQTALEKEIARQTESINKQASDTTELSNMLRSELDPNAKSQARRLQEEQDKLGVIEGYKSLQNINNQIAQATAAYNAGIVQEGNRVAPRQFVAGQQAQLRLQQAAEIGALTAAAQAQQGNIALAEQIAARTVNAEFADREQRISTLQSLIELNYQDLTAAEKRRADLVLEQTKRENEQIEQEKADRAAIQQTMIDAANNGADNDTLRAIMQSMTPLEATISAAQYLQSPDYQVLDVGGNKVVFNKNTGQIEKTLGRSDAGTTKLEYIEDAFGNKVYGYFDSQTNQFNPLSVPNSTIMPQEDLALAINTALATSNLSNDARKAVANNVNQYLQQGDVGAAKDALLTAIQNKLSATENDKLLAWEQGYQAVVDIEQGLEDLRKAGIDTGFLVGKSEEALQKIGQTTDTETARLKAKVAMAIINYRKNVSGAAFTESEAREYTNIFPSIGKTKELNDALIKNLKESFTSNKDGFIRRKVGNAAYDTIFGSTSDVMPVQPLNQSYASLDTLVQDRPDVLELIGDIRLSSPGISDEQTLLEVQEILSFNQPLSMGENRSDVSSITDNTKVVTSIGSGTATGIERGSLYFDNGQKKGWEWGYDLVLDGGKGAPVKAPFTGEVVEATKAKGWGKTVKIKLEDGRQIRLSHLDNINVKPGQKITAGTVVGAQGNTGDVRGNTGIHVDITMYKPDGGYYTSREVASLLNTRTA